MNFKEGEVPKILADRVVDLKELRDTEGMQDAKPENTYGSGAAGSSAGTRDKDIQPEGIVKIKLPQMPEEELSDVIRQIKGVMSRHRGGYQSIIYFPKGGSSRTDRSLWIEPDEAFRNEITDIVGKENFKI